MRIVQLIVAFAAALVLSVPAYALPAPDSNSVLILDSTVYGGAGSREAVEATSLGLTPVIVNGATWASTTAAEFATYRAVILGDPRCTTSTSGIAAAEANAAVWGASVNGNVFVIGSDPVYHYYAGRTADATAVISKGIAFATADAGKTGAYITLSCYYHFAPALTPVPLLDAFSVGGFSAIGGSYIPGLNNVHIVATHPSLSGLADANLSNWGNSVHEGFTSWPVSFEVLAMAIDGTKATFTAPDGTVGVPYVLARGVQVITSIDLSPDSAINPVGTTHTVTALVEEDGVAIVGTTVTFTVIDGPSAGTTGTATTDASGMASFSWSSSVAGIDTIEATYVTAAGVQIRSDRVTKEWSGVPPIVCNAGPDDSVNEATAYTLDGSASSGGAGTLSYLWSGPYGLDADTSATPSFTSPVVSGNLDTLWTLVVSDEAGQVESCAVTITVIDSDLPPDCSNATASESLLWPPNHKTAELSITGVVDTEGGASLAITGITQDEPTNGLGDGDMSPDATFDGATAMVRAERSGLGDGRVYVIDFTASDTLGQSCSGSVAVGVPHDKKDTPVDSGQSFDSTLE